MYYITNQNEQIISIDSALLSLLDIENIHTFYKKIALEDIVFSSEDENLTIETLKNKVTYKTKRTNLSGLLGDITLIQVQKSATEEILITETKTPVIEEILITETKTPVIEESIETSYSTDAIDNNNEQTPIIVDVKKVSEEIGISEEDYHTFLTEYLDTTLTLKKDIQSHEKKRRSQAIETLLSLSNVLHLPMISEIISRIKNSTADTQDKHITSFYATLSRLTTPEQETKSTDSAFESFGTIDLNDIRPIHFDFQLGKASKELDLPTSLIKEFIDDFIEQSHTETEKMLKAYEKGDLDTIQKIGHLLKGASSNLRIVPLSDTLHKIQFCKDSSELEKLIKRYWAHFLSLEIQSKRY